MIERILYAYLESLKLKNINFDDAFIESEYRYVEDLLNYTNLSNRTLVGPYIDTLHLPQHLNNLYNDFSSEICYGSHSHLVTVCNYDIVQPIVGMLVESLFKKCLLEDTTLPRVLYIDTESLVSDLITVIAQSKDEHGRTRRLRNSLNIIDEYIYSAQVVFWDRFKVDYYQEYFYNYIYEILKSRYDDCLSNIYFVNKDNETFFKGMDISLHSVLDVMNYYDISTEQYTNQILLQGEDVFHAR